MFGSPTPDEADALPGELPRRGDDHHLGLAERWSLIVPSRGAASRTRRPVVRAANRTSWSGQAGAAGAPDGPNVARRG